MSETCPEEQNIEPASRPITREETRDSFLRSCVDILETWEGESVNRDTRKERMEGMLYSLLAMLDGRLGGSPGFHLIPSVHKDDEKHNKEIGCNYYPYFNGSLPEGVYTIGGGFHEEIYEYIRHEK